MSRETKDGKTMTFHLKREAVNALEKYCQYTGASKTGAVEVAILKMVDKEMPKQDNSELPTT